jgi:ADP-ribose pyrophosphatase YjhB (NUDIX family)
LTNLDYRGTTILDTLGINRESDIKIHMTPERAKLFSELLKEVVEVDGGFVPEEAWMTLHKFVPLPTAEVMMVQNQGREFLLSHRTGKHWNGWHIPGSYIRRDETLQATCNRVAREEVGLEGVTGLRQIAILKWTDHPFGAPVSIVMVCHPIGLVVENENLKFFDYVPSPIVQNHAKFLGAYLNFLGARTSAQILDIA